MLIYIKYWWSQSRNVESPWSVFTYIDQAEVVLIDRKLLRSNLFLQSRGIGALQMQRQDSLVL